MSSPGAAFPRKRKLSLRWLPQSPPRGPSLSSCRSVQASVPASLPPARTELRERRERNPLGGVEQARRAGALVPLFRTPCLGTPQPGPAAKARRGLAGSTPLGN